MTFPWGRFLPRAQGRAGELGAVYVEADILATAPRLLKCAEQLGFVRWLTCPPFIAARAVMPMW